MGESSWLAYQFAGDDEVDKLPESVTFRRAVCHDILHFCARVLAIFARHDYAACPPKVLHRPGTQSRVELRIRLDYG